MSDIRLDVHVLTLPQTPAEWVEERRSSLKVAVENAGFEVTIHEVPGIWGQLGKARYAGYSHGTAPFVSYVDDDDMVRPDAFKVLLDPLQRGRDAVFTYSTVLGQDKVSRKLEAPHHLCVYRRELVYDPEGMAVVDCEAYTWAVDIACRKAALMAGNTEIVEEAVYLYRANGRSFPVRKKAPMEEHIFPLDAETLKTAYRR